MEGIATNILTKCENYVLRHSRSFFASNVRCFFPSFAARARRASLFFRGGAPRGGGGGGAHKKGGGALARAKGMDVISLQNAC